MTVFMTKAEPEKFGSIKSKNLERARKKFIKKKLNHYNSEKFNTVYTEVKQEICESLYLVRFKSSLSPYLYLYLKSKSEESDFPREFSRGSQPVLFNVQKFCSLTKFSRNTVKKALKELISLNMIIKSNERHRNKVAGYIIFNDF